MAEKKQRKKFLTPPGRLTFPAIFEKERPMENATTPPQYAATIVFNKDELKRNPTELARFNAIKKEIDACFLEKFKKPYAEAKLRIPTLHNPLRDGLEKEHLEGYGAGTIFFKAKSKRRPGVVGPDTKTIIDDPEGVYSGCYVRLSVTPYAYDKGGGKGVALALNSVMFVKDGERLDGVSNPTEDFDEIAPEEGLEPGSADDLL